MREIVEQVGSKHLGNDRRVWIRRPDSPGNARQLVLFLDAEMYRDKVEAPAVIDDLRAAGAIPDAWFVFVSSQSPEARWKECPCHPPFASFVSDELLPGLTQIVPELASVPHRTVAGLSYTGLAAAYLALEKPGLFGRVISQSGSFWWNDGWLGEAYARTPQRVPTSFYLEVGARETQANLQHREGVFQAVPQIEAVLRFRDALLAQGYDVTYLETDGAHDTTAWRQSLPAALDWALNGRERTRQHAR